MHKDPLDSPNPIPWGLDGDLCCNEDCFEEAKKQMNNFYRNIAPDKKKFEKWLTGQI